MQLFERAKRFLMLLSLTTMVVGLISPRAGVEAASCREDSGSSRTGVSSASVNEGAVCTSSQHASRTHLDSTLGDPISQVKAVLAAVGQDATQLPWVGDKLADLLGSMKLEDHWLVGLALILLTAWLIRRLI